MKGDTCGCFDLAHPHKPGQCPNPEHPTGRRTCEECLWFAPNEEHKCIMCGAPVVWFNGESIYSIPPKEDSR